MATQQNGGLPVVFRLFLAAVFILVGAFLFDKSNISPSVSAKFALDGVERVNAAITALGATVI